MANFIKSKENSVSDQRNAYLFSRNALFVIGLILFLISPFLTFIMLLGSIILNFKAKELKSESQIEKNIKKEIAKFEAIVVLL